MCKYQLYDLVTRYRTYNIARSRKDNINMGETEWLKQKELEERNYKRWREEKGDTELSFWARRNGQSFILC